MKKVIIIGAGAAGLMAAISAAKRGLNVTLLEKNKQIGKKLLISGKGRCNITNYSDIEDVIANIPGNGRFMYSAIYNFSNFDIYNFFEENGLKLKVERGNRVFPVSDNAADVVETLQRVALENGAKIWTSSNACDILVKNSKAYGVRLDNGQELLADSVIIATGGASYPGTGSDGYGIKLLKKLGHTIIDLRPSLIPLISHTRWIKELMGLSLRNVEITFTKQKKKLYQEQGEMLFTHFGVSGPVILSASRHLLKYDYRDVECHIDLKPALDEQKLDARLIRDFKEHTRKQFKNSLDKLLPNKMIPVIVNLSGINPEKKVDEITKEERRALVNVIKNLTFTIDGARPLNEAIVTAGGVKISEINPSTMESKLIENLYLAGELIDVDGYTGGYNLTIAFSTGYLAGQNA